MIPGYDRQMKYLDRVRRRGRLAHAYLFYGPDAAGMLVVAKSLAKSLHCPNYGGNYGGLASIVGEGDGCRECAAVAGDMHPSVILLDLTHTLISKKEVRADIPVDDIRELKRLFSLSSPDRAWRVAIIAASDKMSGEAADAFLKLLEEPGERTLFILISDARDSVSPTIRSRTVPLGFLGAAPAPTDERAAEVVLRAIAAGIPEALAASEKIAGDRGAQASALHALLMVLRAQLHAAVDPRARTQVANALAYLLDIATMIETTNVNPRLALDAALLKGTAEYARTVAPVPVVPP